MNDKLNAANIIGTRLRELRKDRQWTLIDVANKTGISVGTLSKLENGKTKLNFTSVNKLAEGLGVAVTDLTNVTPTSITGRRDITLGGHGIRFITKDVDYEVLCNAVSGQNQGYLRATIKQHDVSPDLEWHRHHGEEFIYVLSGELEIRTELYEPLTLKAGDSLMFDASMGHHYVSVSEEYAECLISFSLKGYKNVSDSLRNHS